MGSCTRFQGWYNLTTEATHGPPSLLFQPHRPLPPPHSQVSRTKKRPVPSCHGLVHPTGHPRPPPVARPRAPRARMAPPAARRSPSPGSAPAESLRRAPGSRPASAASGFRPSGFGPSGFRPSETGLDPNETYMEPAAKSWPPARSEDLFGGVEWKTPKYVPKS